MNATGDADGIPKRLSKRAALEAQDARAERLPIRAAPDETRSARITELQLEIAHAYAPTKIAAMNLYHQNVNVCLELIWSGLSRVHGLSVDDDTSADVYEALCEVRDTLRHATYHFDEGPRQAAIAELEALQAFTSDAGFKTFMAASLGQPRAKG